MTEQEIASLKEQLFDHSPTHTPTSNAVPPADTPPVDNPETDLPPADTPLVDISPEVIVDANDYLKTNLGYDSWETAKAEIEQLRQLKDTPIKFENELSKQLFEAIQAGKTDDIYSVLATQKKLSEAETLPSTEVLKLHIEQTNKHFKSADVEDVYEEKYGLPDKPIQGMTEDDEDFTQREERYKSAVDKINRRIERDAVTAKEDLLKLKAEIKLPTIPNQETDALKAYNDSIVQAQADHKILTDSLSKLSEKDISLQLNFNDEASKMKFDVSYQADKTGTEKAKAAAANYMDFLSQTYYKEDGSPLADKLTSDIYFLQNREKIMTEAVKQAVNETKAWFLRNQKNIGDGVQRNFNVVQPDAIQKLKEQVFG